MKKFLMLTLLALFASTDLFGQGNLNFAESFPQNIVLRRAGFSKLKMGDEKFSFAQANKFIADADVIRKLQSGLRLEKAAIGFGVAAVATFGGAWALFEWDRPIVSGVLGFMTGTVGMAFGITAIALGTSGAVKISKTIKGYNNQSPVTLGFAPTPGGMGLQLTF
jgi:hypothetical protein